MYTNLEPEELGLLVASLSLLTIEPAKVLRDRLQAKIDEHLDQTKQAIFKAYRDAASATYDDEGVKEVDENALVSIGDDDGAYIMIWVWIDAADAGICRTCGDPNADNGEGFDGECGSCADKAFAAEEEALGLDQEEEPG